MSHFLGIQVLLLDITEMKTEKSISLVNILLPVIREIILERK